MNMIFSPVYVYKLYIYIYTHLQKGCSIENIYQKYIYLFFAHKNKTIFEKKTKDIYIISIHIFNVKMFFFLMYSYTTCRIQFYGDGFDDVSFQKFLCISVF